MRFGRDGLRPVYVVGAGLHPYQAPSQTPYTKLGAAAVRAALTDAGVEFERIGSVYTATAFVGVSASRPMLRSFGAFGAAMVQVENASASGSSAFRQACMDVAAGVTEVSLAVGVDKPAPRPLAATLAGTASLVDGLVSPATQFALLASQAMDEHGLMPEDLARVAVKNLANAARNPFAQRQEALTLDEVLGAPRIAGPFTKWQCCPIGEGAAAVLVTSDPRRLGPDQRDRSIPVRVSVSRTERVYDNPLGADAALTKETVDEALGLAEIDPADLDLVELHDAFSIEELLYLEAIGISDRGGAARELAAGAFDIGGRCAVSASGGLIGMGHPVGPTGLGQVVELVRQLRGEAGDRQHPRADTALAHMIGVGSVCVVHVLGGPR